MKLIKKYFRWLTWVLSFRKRQKDKIRTIQDVIITNQSKLHFNVGDKVESFSGNRGEVILLYRDIKTNIPVGCTVRWDEEVSSGTNFSINLPVVDLGRKFNPIIRKYLPKK